MELLAGERYRLTDQNTMTLLTEGKAEVYALTKDENFFRQLFLMELSENQAAFPALDEFNRIDIEIYAVENSKIEFSDFTEAAVEIVSPLMQNWFAELIKLPWLRLLAYKGDDMLQKWVKNTAIPANADKDELNAAFTENEQILAMMLGIRFRAEDAKLEKKIETKNRQKIAMAEEAIGNLLGKESVPKDSVGGEDEDIAKTVFIVKHIARSLSMPTNKLTISKEAANKLDQVGILKRLIQKGNMEIRLITLVKDWYRQDSGAIIGYYTEPNSKSKTELAALIPTAPGKYRIFTSSHPEGEDVTEEIANRLNENAFACYGGFPARKLKIIDLFKFMFRQSWKIDYQMIVIISLIAGVIPLVTPIITETIFKDIIPILDRQGLATVTQVTLVTSFTLAAVSIARSIVVLRITTHLDMATEAALWHRLLTLPTKFFRRFTNGELAQCMRSIESIKSVVGGEFATSLFNTLFSFWSLFLMCYYSIKLTAVALIIWLVYALIMVFVYRRVVNFQREKIAAGNQTAGIVQQIFQGLTKFRIQGSEETAYYLWSKKFSEEWKWNLKLRWQDNYNAIIGSAEPFLLTFGLYYISATGLSDGSLGIGYAEFLAFQSAYTGLNSTLNSFIPIIGKFFEIQPHIENLRPILEEEPEITEDKVDAEKLTGAIDISHISFAYGEGLPNVLDDLDIKIAAGENVAIVGKSGCGKSTLIRLLLGFEEPKKGAVYYDGQDLAELSASSVRSQMGVVLQNGQLMTGDIFTNIVGTMPLTEEDAWDAAKAAGVADDIAAMPMGMKTMISEGSSNISGGQRQRILIARALVAKPSVIIFDEATSALDNRTQAIVTESLNKMPATRIVVAHRLSTIQECDRIIVLDKGKVAESGGYKELVAKGGLFSDMAKRQLT